MKYGVIVKLTIEILEKANISTKDIEQNNIFMGIDFRDVEQRKLGRIVVDSLGITEGKVDTVVWTDHHTDMICVKVRSDNSCGGILPEVQEGYKYPYRQIEELIIGKDAR